MMTLHFIESELQSLCDVSGLVLVEPTFKVEQLGQTFSVEGCDEALARKIMELYWFENSISCDTRFSLSLDSVKVLESMVPYALARGEVQQRDGVVSVKVLMNTTAFHDASEYDTDTPE